MCIDRVIFCILTFIHGLERQLGLGLKLIFVEELAICSALN